MQFFPHVTAPANCCEVAIMELGVCDVCHWVSYSLDIAIPCWMLGPPLSQPSSVSFWNDAAEVELFIILSVRNAEKAEKHVDSLPADLCWKCPGCEQDFFKFAVSEWEARATLTVC